MLLTNKIYEGNLFMRYSKHLTYAERMFLRARLNRVRHITLDPDGPGVVRIHLVPCHKPDRETPFTAILNGQDILPLNVSWAILLTNFIEALKPYTGKEADAALSSAYITANKNSVPNDPRSPFVTSGVRIGTPAITRRGFKEAESIALTNWICDVLDNHDNDAVLATVREKVLDICRRFPVYA